MTRQADQNEEPLNNKTQGLRFHFENPRDLNNRTGQTENDMRPYSTTLTSGHFISKTERLPELT